MLASVVLTRFETSELSSYQRHRVLSLAVLSALAFYARQFYIIFCLYFYALCVARYWGKLSCFIKTSLIFAATTPPALYLFYIWGELNPPINQYHTGINDFALVYVSSFVLFYSIPFLLAYCVQNPDILTKVRIALRIRRLCAIAAFIMVYCFIFRHFHFLPRSEAGTFEKLSKLLGGQWADELFVLISSIGALIMYALIRINRWNGLLFLLLIAAFSLTEIIYQRYFDPLLLVMFCLFLKGNFQKYILSRKGAAILLGYNTFYYLTVLLHNTYFLKPG